MSFIKTTLIGGLLIVFPVLLLWLGILEIAGLLIAMAEPIADLTAPALPEGFFDNLNFPGIIAAIVILLVSFIAGLALRSTMLARIGESIERAVLGKLPMYQMLKRLSAALLAGDRQSFTPAVLKTGTDELRPCYIIEDHGNGWLTVLFPLSPAAFAGSVSIVPGTRVDRLACSFDKLSLAVTHFGVGMQDCIETRRKDEQ